MICLTDNDILEEERIGCGAHSDVYRICLNNAIPIEEAEYKRIVVKLPKKDKWNIDEILSKITSLKNAGLRTLSFAKKINLRGIDTLLVEDLNKNDETTFVSPNTKVINYKEDEMLHNYTNSILGNNESYERVENSKAEEYRKKNKLDEIINFEEDLSIFLNEMKTSETAGITLFRDCFFFSSSLKTTSTKINYKIADFDCVNCGNPMIDEDLQGLNQKEFIASYQEFIEKYFNESKLKKGYIECLTKIDDGIK